MSITVIMTIAIYHYIVLKVMNIQTIISRQAFVLGTLHVDSLNGMQPRLTLITKVGCYKVDPLFFWCPIIDGFVCNGNLILS